MKTTAKSCVLLLLFVCLLTDARAQDDWPVWRGPNGNGVAPGNQSPPTNWDESTNVKWKAKVPGRGHSSPILVGDRIFLTTADEKNQTQSVVCLQRSNGSQLWQTTVNSGNFNPRIHGNNTHASPTIVATGDRLFAVFNNNQSVQLACLDHQGKILWQKKAGPFTPNFPFGFGASPCLYKDSVIVVSDCRGKGFIAAFEQNGGSEIWRTPRNKGTSYSSPIIKNIAGKDQLFMSGTNSVISYDPNNGKQIWTVPGPWQVTCGTMVWDNDMVFVSGGFPTGGTLGIKADGSGIVWQNRVKSYEQSLLAHDGFIYAISDNGIGYCWNAKTGKEMWKERLQGPVSASPVLAGGNIYMTNERGTTFVVKANPNKFELVSKNQLADGCFATYTIVDNQIFTRVFKNQDGKNNQWLYCLSSN